MIDKLNSVIYAALIVLLAFNTYISVERMKSNYELAGKVDMLRITTERLSKANGDKDE